MRTNQSGFVPLGGLSAAEQQYSGAKAYNCARHLQAGFPVPDGLVVLSGASDAEIAALAACYATVEDG